MKTTASARARSMKMTRRAWTPCVAAGGPSVREFTNITDHEPHRHRATDTACLHAPMSLWFPTCSLPNRLRFDDTERRFVGHDPRQLEPRAEEQRAEFF